VLNWCLYSGSGWLKPLPDTASYGCFQQPTGSGLIFFINDNAPGAAGNKEARIQGWDSITSILGGWPTGSNPFPTFAQSGIPSGSLIARKTNTVDSTIRSWIVAADSRSFYAFISTGDAANTYLAFGFGDIYSIKTGSLDQYACMIAGRNSENSATVTVDKLDVLGSSVTTAVAGNFMAHTFSGLGTSITIGKHGDGVKGSTTSLFGSVPYLNSADGGVYISPVWVTEAATGVIRGRLRGFYQFLHAISNVSDQQTFTGSGGYAGRTFLIIKQSGNSGVYMLETSDTLETN
jgi:hypothetical protein